MAIEFIEVRHRETGATTRIGRQALRHFPDYEPIDGQAAAPEAPTTPPDKPRKRPASENTKED
ncbi:hypothetical protein [Nonomuraea sp. bgisy101]|uniref:hypothetical protein n=1 Tax=Nonomuraea sp. bgisy101 TaxID=3413784 RepID=UPI003D71C72A